MRMLTISVRSVAAVILVVAVQACAPPEGLPDQAADEAEEMMTLVLPPGRDSLKECEYVGPWDDEEAITVAAKTAASLRINQHVLRIPKEALSEKTTITVFDKNLKSGRIRFQMDPKAAFIVPAELTMSYAHCEGAQYGQNLTILRYPDNKPSDHEDKGGRPDQESESVTATLEELSTYIIATN